MLEVADEALCAAYMDKTGMTKGEALAMMEKETWLTAEQAKERGMVDKVMFEHPEEITIMTAGMFSPPTQEQMERARKLAGKKDETINQKRAKAQAELNLLMLGGKRDEV